MASENPYVNKVQTADGTVIMDISSDTVTPNKVLNGETFHDRSGAPQTGSVITHNVYDGLDSTSSSDALSANQGKILNDKLNRTNYSMTPASGVTLRIVSIKKRAEIATGYIEVAMTGNAGADIGTIDTGARPSATIYFPAWRANTYELLGIISISSTGVAHYYPNSSAPSGSSIQIASAVSYVVG